MMLDHDTKPGDHWSQGRFPENEIISLLDINRTYNLAESTAQDLYMGELVDLIGEKTIREIRLGYGSAQGLAPLRDEIASLSNVCTDDVLLTQGSALALYLLAADVCRAGDEVVLANPWFPPTFNTLMGAGVRVKPLNLTFDQSFAINFDTMKRALSTKTRLVSLASPQNPTGVVTSSETLEQLLELMLEKSPNAFLFVDETYRFATYGKAQPTPSAASLHPRVITSASVTKAFGAPGLRVGWLTTHDKALMDRLITAKMNIVISGSPLDETLALHILRNRDAVLGPRREMLAMAIPLVADWVWRERQRVEWVRPDAGALCCIRLKRERFEDHQIDQFWASQERLKLQLASGKWFGQDSLHFRLGFGYLQLALLRPALEAVSAALDIADAA